MAPRVQRKCISRLLATRPWTNPDSIRSEEHTSELQSRLHLVCRLLLEKKKTTLFPRSLPPLLPQPTATPAYTGLARGRRRGFTHLQLHPCRQATSPAACPPSPPPRPR